MQLPALNQEDWESIPPAVRQKFFSNVERSRIQLAHSDHGSHAGSTQGRHPNHHRFYAGARPGLGPSLHARARHNNVSSTSSSSAAAAAAAAVTVRGLEKRSSSSPRRPRKLRKPDSLQLAYLAVQADSQCFQSLPTKVQQQLFSPEEQLRLRRAYRQSVILDAAHQAFYRRDHKRPGRRSADSETTLPVSPRSAVFWDSSEDEDDAPDPKMDQSLYDSFRWLDEDGDLDLSLDEYHSHVADAATKSNRRRRLSFRQSLSMSKSSLMRKPPPSSSRGPPASSQSPQPVAPQPSRHSTSHPPSHDRYISHAPRSSTSSIDPAAQYYQDPDARLKLRVYLASPQKFDEAIEFGFPALERNDHQDEPNVAPKSKSSSGPTPTTVKRHFGTFFEEDNDGPIMGSPGEPMVDKPAPSGALMPVQEATQPPADSPSLLERRQSPPQGHKPGPQRLPGNREMTLKMTLTRPDLRTESSPTESSTSKDDDPLRLAELPPADRSQSIWDTDMDEQGVVKKMWRKLRRRP